MMGEIIQAIKKTKSEMGNKEVECEWREYKVEDVFECKTTKPFISKDTKNGKIPYVSRTAMNNGVLKYISIQSDYVNDGNCITIGAEGLYAFYQKNDFIAGVKTYTIRHIKMNKNIAMFLCGLLYVFMRFAK